MLISVIYPTGNINVNQNEFFNVTLNVSCVAGNYGTVNVNLDPERIEEIIRGSKEVNEGGQIVGDTIGEDLGFFDKIVEILERFK